MKNHIITLAIAVTFLAAANAKAGLVIFYNDLSAFTAGTFETGWKFSGTVNNFQAGGKEDFGWTLGMTNAATGSTGSAELRFTGYNSNVNNENGLARPTVSSIGLASFGDNRASSGAMSLTFEAGGDAIGSFYFNLKAHSGGGVPFTVTVWDTTGKEHKATAFADHVNDVLFFGFAFNEGVYLERFQIQAFGNSGSNPGFWVSDMGFRGAATPEPATLAMLGLGLAGLGIARRRMKK